MHLAGVVLGHASEHGTVTYMADTGGIVSADTSDPFVPTFCFNDYMTIEDEWRSIHGGSGVSCDYDPFDGEYVNGGNWLRFSGTGGDALPLVPPGSNVCGTGGGIQSYTTQQNRHFI